VPISTSGDPGDAWSTSRRDLSRLETLSFAKLEGTGASAHQHEKLDLYIAEQQRKRPEMIVITVAPVGYRGSWSASIDDRLICPSVRWPFVAAAKALLAEGHAPETEIAMKHMGSTIVAMHGRIGTLAALTDDAPMPEGPLPPEMGSQDGDLDDEGVILPEKDEGRS
jgi:hypothetical protein